MKRVIFQVLLLLLLAAFCIGGYFLTRHFLHLPFRSTNDSLHKNESPITLDFLIPGGTHIDEKMTIDEVIRVRFKQETTFYEKILESLSMLIPGKYLYLADLVLFVFWTFLYMTFMRIFTFMGYGRSLRISLFLGGCTYYFMPDFAIGKGDDFFFIGIALVIIILRVFIHRRKAKPAI
ncbi:hypothetical protein ACFL9T_06905 [Thermodesulfobacteriota bacterium]